MGRRQIGTRVYLCKNSNRMLAKNALTNGTLNTCGKLSYKTATLGYLLLPALPLSVVSRDSHHVVEV